MKVLILILNLISVKVSSCDLYLAKVSHIKQVEGLKQVALLHGKHRVARRQERADVLQAQELQSWGLKKDQIFHKSTQTMYPLLFF